MRSWLYQGKSEYDKIYASKNIPSVAVSTNMAENYTDKGLALGQAQVQDKKEFWTLTVYLRPDFGIKKVWVEAYSQFGKIICNWFPYFDDDGMDARAILQPPQSEFPAGYYYKIGVGTRSLGYQLPQYFQAKSTGQDQVYAYVYIDNAGVSGMGLEYLIEIHPQQQLQLAYPSEPITQVRGVQLNLYI
jgi:hypothetical protein